jgi:hypothetical protein
MAIHSAAVGTQTPPQIVEITPRRLLSYAAGSGESHPCYLDAAAASDMVGHPAFCVALEWPVTLILRVCLAGTLAPRSINDPSAD